MTFTTSNVNVSTLLLFKMVKYAWFARKGRTDISKPHLFFHYPQICSPKAIKNALKEDHRNLLGFSDAQ